MMGFFPHNLALYEQALSHKSFVSRNENGLPANNERLEFLGDAILDAVVGDIVYAYFQRRGEGFLTNMRSKIVQRETLNKLAVEIGLDKMLKSATHLSSHNSYLGGNAFEALVGAIYLDRGYEYCKLFVQKKIIDKYINLDKLSHKEVNFKSKLIEWGQKRKTNVVFQLIEQQKDESGNPIFKTEVLLENISAGMGEGYSKKESQQIASRAALIKLRDHKFTEAVEQAQEERMQLALTENEPQKEAHIEEEESASECSIDEDTKVDEIILEESSQPHTEE